MILTFRDFELDIDRYELRQNGQLQNVEPMVFDLITHLAKHPDQVFSRDDLISSVWSGRVVSDATVSTCIKSARKALGDSGDVQQFIKTVRGRGFRFAVEVAGRSASADVRPKSRAARIVPVSASEPSLLVIPFRSLSDDPDAVRLADGLSGDLGTILTRVPLLRLSAQSAKYSDQGVTPSAREIHEETGVDYVLEGKLQEADGHYRINTQLSDAKSGFRLWAEQIVVPGSGGPALDQAVIAVVAKLEPQLQRAIYNTVRATDGEPNARELYLEASGILALKGWHHESFSTAAGLLRRSWKLDLDFALAPSYLSLVMGLGDRVGLIGNRDASRKEALAAAERALELDGMDSTVLGFSGCAIGDIGYPDRALPILKNSVEMNPANAQAWAALGSVCLLKQQVDEAVAHLTHGINISPLDSRLSIWGAMLALALMLSKDLEGALHQSGLACQRDHRSYMARVVLAAVHMMRNEKESALQARNDAYRIKPDLTTVQISALLGRKLGGKLMELG